MEVFAFLLSLNCKSKLPISRRTNHSSCWRYLFGSVPCRLCSSWSIDLTPHRPSPTHSSSTDGLTYSNELRLLLDASLLEMSTYMFVKSQTPATIGSTRYRTVSTLTTMSANQHEETTSSISLSVAQISRHQLSGLIRRCCPTTRWSSRPLIDWLIGVLRHVNTR